MNAGGTLRPRFADGQRVRVRTDEPRNAYIDGRVAWVMSRHQDADGRWRYWIDLSLLNRTWEVGEDELREEPGEDEPRRPATESS
jgi:hypothetical protein